MPEFNERLQAIARLRAEARQHEESLYAARIGLRKASLRLGRAERKAILPTPDPDRALVELYAQMAQLNARLAALRAEERELARQRSQFREQERVVEHLTRSLTAARNRAEALRRRLMVLQVQNPPPREEIQAIEAELVSLEELQAQLEDALHAADGRLQQQSRREPELRERQDGIRREIDSLRAGLQSAQGIVAERLRPEFDDVATINSDIAGLKPIAERRQADAKRTSGELASAIGGLYLADPHPRKTLALLDDSIPFLLFPVRIETIFAPAPSREADDAELELRVRIYPDDIVIHTHEPVLTDREVDAGRLYWVELVVAAHLRSERDRRQRAAWTHVVNLFGGQRAAWVARKTKPTDWQTLASAGERQSLIDFLRSADAGFFDALRALPLREPVRDALVKALRDQNGDAFFKISEDQGWGDRINSVARTQIRGFPPADLTKTDAWSRAPRTNVLPDRFVLLLYGTEDAAPREIPGALIPDTVFLGPEPLDPKDTIVTKDGALTLGGACEWMSDFDKAVSQGLGFRVSLSEQEALQGFARIAVLGLRLSASAGHSARMLEELIGNHQFSPKGFSLVLQGTPTNNTERNGAGYSDNDPYDDLAFLTEIDPPAFDPAATDPLMAQTDGRLLADALGIGYPALHTVQHADQTDILEARAMNTALFPSTLGYWLRNWMSPVVTPQTARLTRTFFTEFVTGRGPLPAIRVGNQPYGILLTSDMSRWKYPTPEESLIPLEFIDEQTPFLTGLHRVLLALEKRWNSFAEAVSYVGKPGSDPPDVLMNVLGLHPTSVEFWQRIGFHEEYLRTVDSFMARSSYAGELASLVQSMPPTVRNYINDFGFDIDAGTVARMLAMHVLWQHYVSVLDVPNLVEDRPPSETETLTFNYIDWLSKAQDTGTIISEKFTGPKPSALLYAMLRNALLLQLHHGAYDWLKERSDFDPALERALLATTLPGVRGSTPTLSKFELMAIKVDAVSPTHPAPGTSVADWIWRGPRAREDEAAFVKQQRAALEQLAQASTARLERCLVEHLDCCQYRLDAWETGLFAQRLQTQRRSGSPDFERRTGIYLGAFGWVEHVQPSPKRYVRRDDLPPSLRPVDQRPVLEEDDVAANIDTPPGSKQGGYVHAPSLNHAAAAALLRNAYLTHANAAQAGLLSINLSSERMRRAQFILEGMRNGQPVEALLGYQFERGLHDRTSASAARGDVPVLELNQFIAPYRAAFPFESREIPQAGTEGAAETVPPYSVVNGLNLMTASLTEADGYGLAAVLPLAQWPDANQGAAALAERNALQDTLDAVKDLLMAENAYQLVLGNFDRVAAVSLAQKDGRIPPTLEVLNTPRGSEFIFTNRVTLHFDDLDPSLATSNPWPGVAMTPRALAEPGMNFWLGTVLGRAPDQVLCNVYRLEKAGDGADTILDRHAVTLADLDIQPIDFVALTGINAEDAQGATELETRIAYQYRRTRAIANDKVVRIDFNPAGAARSVTFGQLLPLARRLRAIVNECRPLGAQDFLPAAGGKATTIAVDKNNPSGYDVAELRARVQDAFDTMKALAEALDGPSAPTVDLVLLHDPETPADNEHFSGELGDAFAKLEQAGLDFGDKAAVTVNFAILDAETLAATLRSVASFGISDAFPPEADLAGDSARRALLSRAWQVARRLRAKNDGVLDRAKALIGAATSDKPAADQVTSLVQAAQLLFATTLNFIPRFRCYNENDLATSSAGRAQLLSHAVSHTPGLTARDIVDEWLHGVARVRPRMHMWEIVRTLADALNDVSIDMRPAQVPYRDKDSWLAVEFPESDPLDPTKPFGISRDTLSITAHGNVAFRTGVYQRGLLLDEWTEEIPTARENTGITFRFNQPNAMPPQTLLLAVTPEETGSWSWDDLIGTLNDTLARAKRRAVEPEQLEKEGFVWGLVWNALAPALVSEFSTLATADVSLDLMTAMKFAAVHEFYATYNPP